jgi:exodeoxyribonuclease VII large subunit
VESHSLYELNEYVKRVIALNFPQPVWINCEIAQIKEVRGNVYLDLVEQDSLDNVIAQASAVIWHKSNIFIKNKLGRLANSLLQPGSEVKLKVIIEFNERYGFKLIIEDIDPTYTLGKLEIHRQNVIEGLKAEGLLDLNKRVKVPLVIQKIAIISAESAAGYLDFVTQLAENQYGYDIEHHLYNSAMQGVNTERDVCGAFETIFKSKHKYDAIFIIRGGGSKLDLSYFDNFNIGAKIAKSQIPVFTGIGHEIDQSIADMVANRSFKTPTACADFLLEKMANFESAIINLKRNVGLQAEEVFKTHITRIHDIQMLIKRKPLEFLHANKTNIELFQKQIKLACNQKLSEETNKLNFIDQTLKVSNPELILKRGFTLLKQKDTFIKSISNYNPNEITEITFYDGKIKI